MSPSGSKEVTLTAAMIKEVRGATRAGTLDCLKKQGKDRPHKVYV